MLLWLWLLMMMLMWWLWLLLLAGTNTAQTIRDERLINRFDYDGDYGTVLTRLPLLPLLTPYLTPHLTPSI